MNPFALAGIIAEAIVLQIRTARNKNTSIEIPCKRCHSTLRHPFDRFDPGWSPVPFHLNKIFKCAECGVSMYENGEILVTFFDRVDGFIHYPKLMETINELELLVARDTNIAAKHSEEILRLKSELNKINSDKDLITRNLRALITRIKKEKG